MRVTITAGPVAGRSIEVDRELLIGRIHPVDILIEDPRISARHAVIRPAGDAIEVEDVGSSNGTFVGGERISAPRRLEHGDQVRVGDTVLRVEAPAVTAPGEGAGWSLAVRTGPDAGLVEHVAQGTVIIGRDENVGLRLTDSRVSNRHAEAMVDSNRLILRDLGSANGTLVDGQKVKAPVAVRTGAEIQVGESVIVASLGEAAAAGPAPTVIGTMPSEVSAPARKPLYAAAAAAVAALVGVGALAFAMSRGDEALDAAEVVKKNRNATVLVLSKVQGQLNSIGSGFVVDAKEGLIVTNNHVATGGELSVQPEALRTSQPSATIVAAMPCEDLALLKVEDTNARNAMRAVTLSSTPYEQGDAVVALGYPGSAEGGREFGKESLSATSGIVSKVEAKYDVPGSGLPLLSSVVQHSAAVNPGNSGGPLFDDRGELIGVNTAIFIGGSGLRAENESYAVSEKRLKERLQALKDGKSSHWLGMSLGGTVRDNEGNPLGVQIAGVTPNSPAGRAGIVPGLYLVAANNRPVFDTTSYCEAVPADEGSSVTVTLAQFDGTLVQQTLTVGNG